MKSLISLLFLFSLQCYAKSIVVLEIDSGISLSHQFIKNHVKKENWNNYNYQDDHGHGSHIAGIIISGTCEEVELKSCRYFNLFQYPDDRLKAYMDCLKLAIKIKPDIINFSSGGESEDNEELKLLKQLKMPIVVAAGNDKHDLKMFKYYPASYDLTNIIAVGNLNQNGTQNSTSNYGKKNMVWEVGTEIYSSLPGGKMGRMTGTSQAAAKRTNRILRQMCRKLHGI